jgi:uncharacterized protein involved in exopolysaccharide biosynthesis
MRRANHEGVDANMQRDAIWVVAVSLVVALAVVVGSAYQPPKYEATATVLAEQRMPNDGKVHPIPLANPPERIENASREMVRATDSLGVARATVERLNLPKSSVDKVLENINAEQESGTITIRLTYTATDPARAKDVVNTFARIACERISDSKVVAVLWQPATFPTNPVSPQPFRNRR